jgi:transposase
MIRVLRVARRSAMRAKIATINQLHALVVSAPDELRETFDGLTTMAKVRKAATLRPGPTLGTVEAATKLALKKLARRYLALADEIAALLPLPWVVRPLAGGVGRGGSRRGRASQGR